MTSGLLPDADKAFAGPDLTFQSAGTIPPLSGADGRVVDMDGRTWDFNLHGVALSVTALMAKAFASMLSRNLRPASRLRTNTLFYYHVRSFLEFVAGRAERHQYLDRGLLQSYKDHLFREHAAVTAYGKYNTVRWGVSRLGLVSS